MGGIVFSLSLFSGFSFYFPSRTMYWADWGNHPKIETAAMDGTLRQTLVQENIQWPTGQKLLRSVRCDRSRFLPPLSPPSSRPRPGGATCPCLRRSGGGLLQRPSVLGRREALCDRQCSPGRLRSGRRRVRHQKQLRWKNERKPRFDFPP